MRFVLTTVKTLLNRLGIGNDRWRRRRMQAFLTLVRPEPGSRILDLGGSEHLWRLVDHDFEVTIVNLVPTESAHPVPPGEKRPYQHVVGDATDLDPVEYPDKSYDVVFSNSVIEHVGGAEKQAALARQVMRLSDSYWVQTPSDRFPLEPHTGVPFYWRLPDRVKRRLHARWRQRTPVWLDMVLGTTVLTRAEMIRLFPDALRYTERVVGLEKSYAFYRPVATVS